MPHTLNFNAPTISSSPDKQSPAGNWMNNFRVACIEVRPPSGSRPFCGFAHKLMGALIASKSGVGANKSCLSSKLTLPRLNDLVSLEELPLVNTIHESHVAIQVLPSLLF